jgi:protein TonB
MVRFKIESRKKYPEAARIRYIEGRVTVGFVLTAGGQTQAVTVVKSSGRPILDQAAMAAVKDASPFPQPPPGLFKEKLQMTIIIVFELT